MITFTKGDVQDLAIKYYNRPLQDSELATMEAFVSPRSWSKVEDGGYEGCLSPLISSVLGIIQLSMEERWNPNEDV